MRRRGRGRWGALLAFAVVGLALFPSSGRDDKYITYWPALTLARQGEMLNYNGERVEQSSSLLFVLGTAAGVRAAGLSPPWAGWLLGLAGAALAIALAGVVARRIRPELEGPALWITALCGPFLYWSFSGSEPPWVAATALAVVAATGRVLEPHAGLRHVLGAAGATVAFLAVRPESPIVLICTALGIGAVLAIRQRRAGGTVERSSWRGLALFAGVVVVGAGLLALFRWSYFGSAMPQPVMVKSRGVDLEAALQGLRYLGRRPILWPLLISAVLGAGRVVLDSLRGSRIDATALGLASFGLSYLSFIVLAGGDWMEASRFVAHVAPVLAVLAVYGWAVAGRPGWLRTGAFVLVAASAGSAISIARSESLSLPLWTALSAPPMPDGFGWLEGANRAHRRDVPVAQALDAVVARARRETPGRVFLCAENAGFVVYQVALRHGEAVGVIDLHGLSDRIISETPVGRRLARSPFGLSYLEKWFYDDYDEMNAEAPVPYPEIAFFNAHHIEKRTRWMGRHGFEIAYHNGTPLLAGPAWLAGSGIANSQAIAVSGRLADGMRELELPGNQWHEPETPSSHEGASRP